ncbi:hypothetical protein GCM10010974_36530 [Brevibacterium sediminis]|uniref:Gram-positive cocci surface proteins LPxTG domain-containing protein n=1 Tax=Brevibacterium sediminis TaxID=1857024 RepID=A0ABQ1N4S9_9MICO|nr:LPXTG cell wall anchor domain-containing protein [Brevibacterium sediminis]GGC51130.1 hypothetical protein GCM10010974_36530 [Brevibacterium sediminis]
MKPKKTKGLRRVLGAAGVGALGIALLGPIAPASAADVEDGSFSGGVRNYGAFAGVGLVNNLANVRANIAESVVVADSSGLADYSGTGTGEYAVPGTIAGDETARAYSRAAPVGAGAIGLNINLVNAEASSTTDSPSDEDTNDFGNLDIPILGTLEGLTGAATTDWSEGTLTGGGSVANAESTTGDLDLITGLGDVPLPGIDDLFPVGEANLGLSTSDVSLTSEGAACDTGLGVESTATWRFADVNLFGGEVGVSWGGETGSAPQGEMIARANGVTDGAEVEVSTLPSMAIKVGDADFVIEPGGAIELDQIFEDGGLGDLANLVSGEITYGGPTNIEESADGTHASGTMGGLQADLALASVPVVAPDGLGSIELGFERADVFADISEGGINCTDDGGDDSASADADGTDAAEATADDNGTDTADASTDADGADTTASADADGTDTASADDSASADDNGNVNAAASASASANADDDGNPAAEAAAEAAADNDANTTASAAADNNAEAAAESAGAEDASSETSADATSDPNASAQQAANAAANGDNSDSTNADASSAADADPTAAASSAATADSSSEASADANGTDTASAAGAGSAATGDSDGSNAGGNLPRTGSDATAPLLGAAAVLLAAGAAATYFTRRRATK